MVQKTKNVEIAGEIAKKEINYVQFSQSMSGEHFIQQGDQKIVIDLCEADEKQIREVLNGLANILSSMGAHLYDRIKEAN